MTVRKRIVVMGLVVMALMVLSTALSMARTFPINPLFLAPGLREQGAYTMQVPGTYGHLIPILPFPWAKDKDPMPSRSGTEEGGLGSAGHTSNNVNLRPGTGSLGTAPPSGKIGGSGSGSPVSENMGMPMGNVLSGSIVSNHVDALESDLRDAIRKLNSK